MKLSRYMCALGRLNIQKSIVSFHRKFSIRGRKFYEDCRFPFSKIPLGTVWFLAKTVLFFPRHVLLQLITDLDESSKNRFNNKFSLIGIGQFDMGRCIDVMTRVSTSRCNMQMSSKRGFWQNETNGSQSNFYIWKTTLLLKCWRPYGQFPVGCSIKVQSIWDSPMDMSIGLPFSQGH